jgi:ABC-type branched-subunit amino acid transport system substrate-binding protein
MTARPPSRRDGFTAAATLGTTGRYRRQGTEAAEALRLWAEHDDIQLNLVDDAGSADVVTSAYAGWIDQIDLLLGPYASDLVRTVAPLFRDTGQLLWNHGGSADDLAQPMIVCLAAPASTYFHDLVDLAAQQQIRQLVIVQGPGPFARAVADGATARADHLQLRVRRTDGEHVADTGTAGTAWLIAGHFDHDVKVMQRLRRKQPAPLLVAAVAAGIRAFGRELGDDADGIYGPVQWWPDATTPAIGPSGRDFFEEYQARTGLEPSYVAAQAAAAGFLARAAHQLQLTAADITQWRTSTLLGSFQLEADWRQVGHRVTTVRWYHGQLARVRR